MPRDHQGDPPPQRHAIEHRDPRMAHRPRDEDVRIDRRDRELYDGLPSVTNRDFAPVADGAVSYRGVGPTQNWRSDERIGELLHERLTGADTINATAVIAAVTDGVVTLNGWVPERPMKHDAEEIAWNIAGVKDVHNRITIGESVAAFGKPGEAVRSGFDQQGSGFSSSDRVDISDRDIGDVGDEQDA
ncbi:BON domain-containing protein [Noviluteimonas gilva]|nr:BON domain-containing protein [Lysobacter gilvus]